MKNLEFPIFKTKSPVGSPKFDLGDPKARQKYYQFKAGAEIAKIRDYLQRGNTFLGIMLAKKNAGKGTFSQIFREVFGADSVIHFSVGDMVRQIDEEIRNPRKLKELRHYLEENYRGPMSVEEIIRAQKKRSSKTLLPTEFILTMIKREISKFGKKTIFLDGFPRNLDQISYSLFFRDLIGFRDDPDFFILIDVPTAVIDQRIKYRVICPKCQLTKSLRLQPARFVRYDREKKVFYLACENPDCPGYGRERMMTKEGDELGINGIKERLEMEGELIAKAFSLSGISKIFLRNSIPLKEAAHYVDDYEITREYEYVWNEDKEIIETRTKNWVVNDDRGRPSVSLLPPPVFVSLVKQLADFL